MMATMLIVSTSRVWCEVDVEVEGLEVESRDVDVLEVVGRLQLVEFSEAKNRVSYRGVVSILIEMWNGS